MIKDKKRLIAILAGIVIIALAVLIFLLSMQSENDSSIEPTSTPTLSTIVGQDKPNANTQFDDINIDLVDYTTYKFDDLDFNFVMGLNLMI